MINLVTKLYMYCVPLSKGHNNVCETIVDILTFMSRINFMLSKVERENSFITSGPGFQTPYQ